MSRRLVVVRAALAIGCGGLLVACSSAPLAAAAPATNVNSLAPPPARPPAQLSGLSELKKALTGVATCHDVGGQRSECALLTSSDHPFQLVTFSNETTKSQYLANLHASDVQARGRGLIPDGALLGGDWAAVPKVTSPGLLPTLRKYLGGQTYS
ncbi:MAG TPA: hypothetical protein VGN54_01025 [Mycobacteriales bacterium]|jgi:hypothetical protein|nr:hypothetical protein [Mycobacteriales bacterium]